MRTFVVVGASLAGFHAAQTLRREGFDERLVVVGAEPHRPYDRPPLSKQFLAGGADSVLDLPGATGDELDVEWRLGAPAETLDLAARRVRLAGGDAIDFDGLVIATGGVVRRLPGLGEPEPAGVHVVRTVDDSRALRADLDAGPDRVVVVGAGFIGAEVAATCRERGLEVTLVEALSAPMAHVLGDEVGGVLGDIQREHGVDLRCGVGVDGVDVDGAGRVGRVRLADGSAVDASVVVVGIGVRPGTDWLEGSGLRLDNGVVCDETCLAAPGVVAAGDVARWPNAAFGGEPMRVEHWENAVTMGAYAARRLLAGDAWDEGPYAPVPWFWSDQYDRKIQLAGRVRPTDDTLLVEGSYDERRFAVLYGRDGRLVGVLGVNRPRQVMKLRGQIEAGISFDEAAALVRG
ncbi:MAG: FAD-dependent oxidoreductase [Acidimicrobiia bacterium]|nr:FAD-dependent oxidoreductase [Acidimicrobiia bacterium]